MMMMRVELCFIFISPLIYKKNMFHPPGGLFCKIYIPGRKDRRWTVVHIYRKTAEQMSKWTTRNWWMRVKMKKIKSNDKTWHSWKLQLKAFYIIIQLNFNLFLFNKNALVNMQYIRFFTLYPPPPPTPKSIHVL